MSGSKKVRVGVFGGRRGQSMMAVLAHHPDAELVAICQHSGPQLEKCRQLVSDTGSNVTCYDDFDKFIEHDMDAVVLANYATEHVPYAIRLLNSGRHVCSELMVCQTMAEAVQLIDAIERSKCTYTYAENVCYFPAVLEMQKIYRRGDIGEFLVGEGHYIQDCAPYWAMLTRGKRDHWRNWTPSTFYVTHSTGPIMVVTGTRPVRVTAYETPNVNKRVLGGVSADASVIVCQMDNGAVSTFMPWANMKRDPSILWFSINGSKGAMETDRWGDTSGMLNLFREGHETPFVSYKPGVPDWVRAEDIDAEFGGADFFTMHYFISAILDRPGKENAIDVYQGLDMTLPGMLGYRSIYEGNVTLDVPDFRKPEVREKYRNDNWCADPNLAGPSQPKWSCASGPVDVPDSVYEAQVAELQRNG